MAVYLNRKIIAGQGGLSINGVIEDYVVAAGENISAGDFVSFVNNQAVGVLEEIVEGDWDNPTIGTEYNFTGTQDVVEPQAVAISDTKALVVYRDGSDGFLKGEVLTISGSTISEGSVYTIESANSSRPKIIELSNNRFVVTYVVFTSPDIYDGYARVLTVEPNDVINVNPANNIANNAEVRPFSMNIATMTPTQFIVRFTKVSAGPGQVRAVDVDAGTNGMTLGSLVSYSTDGGGEQEADVGRLDDTHAIIAYRDGANNDYATARVASISGNTITLGTPYVITSSAIPATIAVVGVSSTKALVAYDAAARTLTISGTSITAQGTPTTLDQVNPTTSFEYVLEEITNDALYMFLFRDDGDSFNGKAVAITMNGDTLTASSEVQFNAGDPEYPAYANLSATKGLIVYQDRGDNSNYGKAILIEGGAGTPTGTYQQIYEIKGVANEAGTAGETIGVFVPDLTPGV